MQPLAAILCSAELLVLAACKILGKQQNNSEQAATASAGLSARVSEAAASINRAVKATALILHPQPSYSTLLPQPHFADTFQRARHIPARIRSIAIIWRPRPKKSPH